MLNLSLMKSKNLVFLKINNRLIIIFNVPLVQNAIE